MERSSPSSMLPVARTGHLKGREMYVSNGQNRSLGERQELYLWSKLAGLPR